jgi:serine/threonine protein kinase
MGDVYLARKKGQGSVAIKLLRADLTADAQFRGRFRRELQIAQSVTGAFAAKVLDADPDAKRPWLATEYVDGPTLLQAVRDNGPLEGTQLHALAIGLLEALQSIHAVGVIHRDLTPSNVLLGEHGPKIVDFGIALPLDATVVTATGLVIGTAAWMAPEQIRGHEVTFASDLFSWALLVAYAARGRSPFGAGRPEAMTHRLVYDEPNLTGIEEPLRTQISLCLAKNPSARPTIEQVASRLAGRDMATELQTYAQNTVQAEWTAPLPTSQLHPRRHHRSWEAGLTIGAVALVLLVGAVVVVLAKSAPGDGSSSTRTTTTLRPAAAASPSTTPGTTAAPQTTAPATTAPSITSIDWNDRSYSVVCGSGSPVQVQLAGGQWVSPNGGENGYIQQVYTAFGDVTGDGAEDAVIYIPCTTGASANAVGGNIFVYSLAGGDVTQLGQTVSGNNPRIDGSGFTTSEPVFAPSDPLCCPSGRTEHHWVWDGSAFRMT